MSKPIAWGMIGAFVCLLANALGVDRCLCVAAAVVCCVIGVWGQGLIDGGYETEEERPDSTGW